MDLKVPYLSCINSDSSLKEVSGELDQLQHHAIGQRPWPEYPYKPKVFFSIAYSTDSILLKYFVQENTIRISCNIDNSPVHEDSCVEFFISFDGTEAYYNLEFNCIGTCLAAFGKSRCERELLPLERISDIRRMSVIEKVTDEGNAYIRWQLTLVIPSETFIHHHISPLKDRNCKVNFYKCGDALPEPHFLSWKDVSAADPDFHLPESFGKMHFV